MIDTFSIAIGAAFRHPTRIAVSLTSIRLTELWASEFQVLGLFGNEMLRLAFEDSVEFENTPLFPY